MTPASATKSLLKLTMYGFSRFSGTAIQFLLLLFIGRVFGQSALGAFATSQSIIVYSGTLIGIGLPAFLLRRTARYSYISSPVIQMWLGVLNSYLILVCVAAIAISILHYFIFSPKWNFAFYICIIGGVSYAACRAYSEILKGQSQLIQSTIYEFTLPLGISFFYLGIVSFFSSSNTYVIQSLAIGYAASALAAIIIKSGTTNLSTIRILIRRISRNIRELISLCFVQIGNVTLLAFPIILTASMLSIKDAAIMGISIRMVGLGATATSIIVSMHVKEAINSLKSRRRAQVLHSYFKISTLNLFAQFLVLLPLILAPSQILQLFSVDITDNFSAQNAVQALASLRLARALLGTPEVFLANSGKSGFDLIGHVLALVAFFAISLLNEPSLFMIAIATGVAALIRGITSTMFAILLVLAPNKDQ